MGNASVVVAYISSTVFFSIASTEKLPSEFLTQITKVCSNKPPRTANYFFIDWIFCLGSKKACFFDLFILFEIIFFDPFYQEMITTKFPSW